MRETEKKNNLWTTELTGVYEDEVHIEFSADGSEDEATGGSEHQRREENSCKGTSTDFDYLNNFLNYSH